MARCAPAARIRRPLGRVRRALQRSRLPDTSRTAPLSIGAEPSTLSTPPPSPNVAPRVRSRLETRREFVFRTSHPGCRILEIGPAHNAILPKRDGYRHEDRRLPRPVGPRREVPGFSAVLARTHRGRGLRDPGRRVHVGRDRRALPAGARLACAGTQLSLIDFLNDCAAPCPGRRLSTFVVPDHRYCFDRFRERSSIARVIDTSLGATLGAHVGTLTDFTLNAVKHRRNHVVGAGPRRDIPSSSTTWSGAGECSKRGRAGDYVDVHNWVFSPNHLRLMLHDLHSLGHVSFREARSRTRSDTSSS